MPEESLAQVTRMVQDNNLPSRTHSAQDIPELQDARFVHPDDTRGALPTPAEVSNAPDGGAPTVLIFSDAAMQIVPKVR